MLIFFFILLCYLFFPFWLLLPKEFLIATFSSFQVDHKQVYLDRTTKI